MTEISDKTQALIEAGMWVDTGEDDRMFLQRSFHGTRQAVYKPTDRNETVFRLSEMETRDGYLTPSRQQDFATLEEALTLANIWRQET